MSKELHKQIKSILYKCSDLHTYIHEPRMLDNILEKKTDEILKLATPAIDLNEVEKLVVHSAYSDAFDKIMTEPDAKPDDEHHGRIDLLARTNEANYREKLNYTLSDLPKKDAP